MDAHEAHDPDEEDDWAPLPPEQVVLHPGEVEPQLPMPAIGEELPTSPCAEPPPAPPPAPTPPDPAQEELLRELQRRVAEAGPSRSLVAQVQHRQQRRHRQRRRAEAATDLQQSVVRAAGDLPPAQVEYERGVEGRDEREDSEWFRNLPEAERERLHAAWAHKRSQHDGAAKSQRQNGNRRMVAAWFVAAVAVFAGSGVNWPATLGAGVATGFWWRHTPPDRLLDPMRAFACLVGLHLVAMAASGVHPLLWMDAVCVVACAGIVGFDGEIARSGGFDDVRRDNRN